MCVGIDATERGMVYDFGGLVPANIVPAVLAGVAPEGTYKAR